jgi:hypothetical protein
LHSRLAFRAEIGTIDYPIQAEGRKSNSMQPVFETTNMQYQGELEASWSVAYYFFGL